MSGGKVPTGPGWWWLHEVTARFPPRPVCVVDRGGLKVRDGQGWYSESPIESVGTWGVSGGTNADHWLGPCLTPAEVDALTARAERAERTLERVRDYMDGLGEPSDAERTFAYGAESWSSELIARIETYDALRAILTGSDT